MAVYSKNEVHIISEWDLEQEMCRYNCKTVEELEEFLWIIYGLYLILDYKYEEI